MRPLPVKPGDVQIQLSPTIRTIFTLAFLLIIGIAILAYRNAWRVYDQSEWVAHSQQVRAAVNGMLLALQDAETGQRGFTITGDEAFLDPYLVAQHDIPQRVRALRDLVRGEFRGHVSVGGIMATIALTGGLQLIWQGVWSLPRVEVDLEPLGTATAAGAGESTTATKERLQQVDDLFDQGLIAEQERKRLRSKILSGDE